MTTTAAATLWPIEAREAYSRGYSDGFTAAYATLQDVLNKSLKPPTIEVKCPKPEHCPLRDLGATERERP